MKRITILFSLAVFFCAAKAQSEDLMSSLIAAHEACDTVAGGENASYIPVLAEVDSTLFAISMMDVNGKLQSFGDVEHRFTLQSISKVFTLAHVLEEYGDTVVLDKIGVNATGKPFNSIEAMQEDRIRTVNPFVNPGAITASSFVKGKTLSTKLKTIDNLYAAFAGQQLKIDYNIYESEMATNNQNRQITALLEAYDKLGCLGSDALELYTKQCSYNVTVDQLSVMAATLANGGVNPVTKDTVMAKVNVEKVLAVMATAGMYQESGVWLYKIGLPAKSGVGGGIIAIVPGKYGIAVFSPPLNETGSSVKGKCAIEWLSENLGLSVF